jgi:soluble epoxide hydrolase/lipid-phosphate phosphatase
MRPLVQDLRVERVDGGHWIQMERKEEVNGILEGFIEGK